MQNNTMRFFFQLGRGSEEKMRSENRENKERKSQRKTKLEKEEEILCVYVCVRAKLFH